MCGSPSHPDLQTRPRVPVRAQCLKGFSITVLLCENIRADDSHIQASKKGWKQDCTGEGKGPFKGRGSKHLFCDNQVTPGVDQAEMIKQRLLHETRCLSFHLSW